MKTLANVALWFAAIGCGVAGGIYFIFSVTVMSSLGRIAPEAGIAAMNAMSADIVRSAFMPLFIGTTIAGTALAILSLFQWSEPGSLAILAGGLIYFAGMFIVTVAFNVPLNNSLAAIDPKSADGLSFWATYLRDWTLWNHVRTAASIAASVLFTAALAVRG